MGCKTNESHLPVLSKELTLYRSYKGEEDFSERHSEEWRVKRPKVASLAIKGNARDECSTEKKIRQ